jgi:hypothetical protein
MAGEAVLELEAKAHGTTPTKLVTARKLTLPDPSDEQVRSTYQANLQALGNKPLEEVRPAIVRFLRKNAEDSLVKAYVEELASKYKINYQTDINTPGIKPGDPLFTVGGRTYTDQEFENKYRLTLYEVKADLIDNINDDLDGTILTDLVNAEASALKIDQQAYVAREVTSKLKTSTDEEKAGLENDLRKRLYAKYNVKFLLSPPAPIAQKISVDDDPAGAIGLGARSLGEEACERRGGDTRAPHLGPCFDAFATAVAMLELDRQLVDIDDSRLEQRRDAERDELPLGAPRQPLRVRTEHAVSGFDEQDLCSPRVHAPVLPRQ